MLVSNPSRVWNIVNPKPHSDVDLVNPSDDQYATIRNCAFTAEFSMPSALNIDAPSLVDYFPMNAISIDFHGVVTLIDSSKVPSCGYDCLNCKFRHNTKNACALFLL